MQLVFTLTSRVYVIFVQGNDCRQEIFDQRSPQRLPRNLRTATLELGKKEVAVDRSIIGAGWYKIKAQHSVSDLLM